MLKRVNSDSADGTQSNPSSTAHHSHGHQRRRSTTVPLVYNDYVKTSINLALENKKLFTVKQQMLFIQNVCIVYSCLAVKRNAGVVGTEAKRAAAAQGYREIAV
ncbi:unnamed protein product, partial [Pylaiella littoralis]